MGDEHVLVTGGTGCIGSWVVRNLLQDGVPVVVVTAGRNFRNLKLILTDSEFDRITFVTADITDIEALESASRRHGIDRIIHLAGLQLPFCAADPARGAIVNVVGTVTVFELAKRLGIGRVVYASSAAVYGPRDRYAETTLAPDAPFWPTSHYGVYKIANEQGAAVYWQNDGISSIGLRPHTVYGPGRDRGMTSKPTLAMIAAAAGRPYNIGFGGRYQFQHTDDAASAFLRAARVPFEGAAVFNIGGSTHGVDEIVERIGECEPGSRGTITAEEGVLSLPEAFDGRPMVEALGPYEETPLEEGVSRTLDCYRAGLRRGILDDAYLDQVLS
jgi:UDP-glucuronate 4-epimerase